MYSTEITEHKRAIQSEDSTSSHGGDNKKCIGKHCNMKRYMEGDPHKENTSLLTKRVFCIMTYSHSTILSYITCYVYECVDWALAFHLAQLAGIYMHMHAYEHVHVPPVSVLC